MIFIATPKQLLKSHSAYGIFEVNDNGTLISIGWDDRIEDLILHRISKKTLQLLVWSKEYPIYNLLEELSKDCIIFTTESHPEYFI